MKKRSSRNHWSGRSNRKGFGHVAPRRRPRTIEEFAKPKRDYNKDFYESINEYPGTSWSKLPKDVNANISENTSIDEMKNRLPNILDDYKSLRRIPNDSSFWQQVELKSKTRKPAKAKPKSSDSSKNLYLRPTISSSVKLLKEYKNEENIDVEYKSKIPKRLVDLNSPMVSCKRLFRFLKNCSDGKMHRNHLKNWCNENVNEDFTSEKLKNLVTPFNFNFTNLELQTFVNFVNEKFKETRRTYGTVKCSEFYQLLKSLPSRKNSSGIQRKSSTDGAFEIGNPNVTGFLQNKNVVDRIFSRCRENILSKFGILDYVITQITPKENSGELHLTYEEAIDGIKSLNLDLFDEEIKVLVYSTDDEAMGLFNIARFNEMIKSRGNFKSEGDIIRSFLTSEERDAQKRTSTSAEKDESAGDNDMSGSNFSKRLANLFNKSASDQNFNLALENKRKSELDLVKGALIPKSSSNLFIPKHLQYDNSFKNEGAHPKFRDEKASATLKARLERIQRNNERIDKYSRSVKHFSEKEMKRIRKKKIVKKEWLERVRKGDTDYYKNRLRYGSHTSILPDSELDFGQ